MSKRTKLAAYPRRTVRIDISNVRNHPTAISERANYDEILILKCGKPHRAIIHFDYFDMLNRRRAKCRQAHNPDSA